MYLFRPFRNTDPPQIAEIWNRQSAQRGLAQPINRLILEERVFTKAYFDRQGLIVAEQDGKVAGFVHAGFGPDESGENLSTEMGVTAMLMVRPEEAPSSLAADLLRRSEAYLRSRGAKLLYAGEIQPLTPFYLGLYGGSEQPGILQSDRGRLELFLAQGYQAIDEVHVLHCDLHAFRAKIDRQQMQHRRKLTVELNYDPARSPWWNASTIGVMDPVRFEARERGGAEVLAGAAFWHMEPLASCWGTRAAGLYELETASHRRREGLATFLLGDAFREIRMQGIPLVEAQVMHHNTPARALYTNLGFTEVDRGVVLRKGS